MVIEASFNDLVLSNAFTGAHAYYLRSSIEAAGLDPDRLEHKQRMDLTGAEQQIKAWKDLWSAGQGVGTIHEVETVAEIVDQLYSEYAGSFNP